MGSGAGRRLWRRRLRRWRWLWRHARCPTRIRRAARFVPLWVRVGLGPTRRLARLGANGLTGRTGLRLSRLWFALHIAGRPGLRLARRSGLWLARRLRIARGPTLWSPIRRPGFRLAIWRPERLAIWRSERLATWRPERFAIWRTRLRLTTRPRLWGARRPRLWPSRPVRRRTGIRAVRPLRATRNKPIAASRAEGLGAFRRARER